MELPVLRDPLERALPVHKVLQDQPGPTVPMVLTVLLVQLDLQVLVLQVRKVLPDQPVLTVRMELTALQELQALRVLMV